jgi:hypothetical protein
MEIAEFEDAKRLWKMFYGHQCFKRAEAAAQHILDERLEQESPLLTRSSHPFMFSTVNRSSERVVLAS